MAVNALTLAACLRPWRGAGIRALLRDDGGCGQDDTEFAGADGDDAAADAADAARAYGDSQDFRRSKPVAYGAEDDAARACRDDIRMFGDDASGAGDDDAAGRIARNASVHGSERAAFASGGSVAARGADAAWSGGGRNAAGGSPGARDAGENNAGPASGVREVAAQSPPLPVREVAAQSPPSHSATGPLPSAAQFSAPWRALLEKTRPAPLVWTYEELGSDLLGDASAERSRCLRALLAALSLPRGSSAFWPLSLPLPGAVAGTAGGGAGESGKGNLEAGEPRAGSSVAGESEKGSSDAGQSGSMTCSGAEFAAGVRLLGAGVVLYLGTAAAMRSGFALTIRAPYTQQLAGGLQHILLPALSALAEGPDQTEKAAAYLRSVLTDHHLLRARAAQGQV